MSPSSVVSASPPVRRLTRRTDLLSVIVALAIVFPAMCLASSPSARVAAQGYESPTIIVSSVDCPDDTGFGDDLSTSCDQPRAGRDIAASGPVGVAGMTDDEGRVDLTNLVAGTYDLTDDSITDDAITLIECRALQGFGGFVNLPVAYGDAPGIFTVDLTFSSGKVGLVDRCTVYVLPDSWSGAAIAGLTVDSAVSPTGNGLGLEIVSPDGARSPVSGAGPALPARMDIDYTLDGGDLDEALRFSTRAASSDSDPDTAFGAGYGPILLSPGDYTLTDTIRSQANVLTLRDGGVTHAVSVGPDDNGLPTSAPDSTDINFLGSSLTGAWTDLDVSLYGDEAGALYGLDSGYANGTLTFDAGSLDTTATATLSLLGLDDERPASTVIVVRLNDTELYRGGSTFPTWDPDATGNQWGYLTIDISPGLLRETGNELHITDLASGSSVGQPPWVMITALTISQES